MKVFLLNIIVVISTITVTLGQIENNDIVRKNEIRANILGVIFGAPELSYERLLGKYSGIGLSVSNGVKFKYDIMLTSYFRNYFGSKNYSGFFIDYNFSFFQYKVRDYDALYSLNYHKKILFGLGLSIGAKYVIKRNFIGEFHVGGGKTLESSSSIFYPRIEIAIGKRF